MITAKGRAFESIVFNKSGRFEICTSFKEGNINKTSNSSIITARRKIKEDADPLRDVMLLFNIESMLSGNGGGLRELVMSHCKNEIIDDGADIRIPFAKSSGSIRLSKNRNYLAVGSEASTSMNGVNYSTSMQVTEFLSTRDGSYIPVAGELRVTENDAIVLAHKKKVVKC